jgi:branched-chain amino acid aminotransferase
MAKVSRTSTFFEGQWHEGNVQIMGPRTHAAWLASMVFDGARYFEGVAPDIDLHCARVNRSATAMGLNPMLEPGAIVELVREGTKKFGPDAALYVRPMYWGIGDGPSAILPDPDDVGFCLCLYEMPLPEPNGLSVTSTWVRRPSIENAPTDAKAGCLYPNNSRALRDAHSHGFDNALVCDALGNVAETATSNIFMAKDGVVKTPIANGTFLNGITRQRIIALLRAIGVTVLETTLRYEDFLAADEIFTSGNIAKVMPVIRIDGRDLQPGPFYIKARKAYWEYAHSG